MNELICEVRGGIGLMTLNRPRALNALSLGMVRSLTATLLAWQSDPAIEAVALRGQGKEGPFGALCAGGDIRFFHQAALGGNPELEDFFTEEYALNHLIHRFTKPYLVFMDGIVMGGGMGIAGHGGERSLRLATERTKMAMPETGIGLFPDVGGGWFLARCPGHIGEYLALTGNVIGGADAIEAGLADAMVPSQALPQLWEALAEGGMRRFDEVLAVVRRDAETGVATLVSHRAAIDRYFGLDSVAAIVQALEADGSDWARATVSVLRKRSPLMLNVVLEQVRRARHLSLADDLRLERDMVRRCFHLRPGTASETVEGIRALAVDKDHAPRWTPASIEEVTREMVQPFFDSPWPAHAHPLRDLD